MSATSTLFDPLHYNNGAVWPFVTGFVSLAEYKYHHAPAGWFALQAVARTGFDQSLGRNPEVISGRLYKPLDTAVPQQFFATSMVLTPLIRGLLGIDVDAPAHRLTIAPHLPPEWDSLAVDDVPVGAGRVSFVLRRANGRVTLALHRTGDGAPIDVTFSPQIRIGASASGAGVALEKTPGDWHATVHGRLTSDLELEVTTAGGWEAVVAPAAPKIGDRSTSLRVVDEQLARDGVVVSLEGLAGHSYSFRLRTPDERTAHELKDPQPTRWGYRLGAVHGAERDVTVTFSNERPTADGYGNLTILIGTKLP